MDQEKVSKNIGMKAITSSTIRFVWNYIPSEKLVICLDTQHLDTQHLDTQHLDANITIENYCMTLW